MSRGSAEAGLFFVHGYMLSRRRVLKWKRVIILCHFMRRIFMIEEFKKFIRSVVK